MSVLTASELYGFHRCVHTLTLRHRSDGTEQPDDRDESVDAVLAMRWGDQHEADFVRVAGYLTLPDYRKVGPRVAEQAALEAMQRGEEKLHQVMFRTPGMFGVADLVRKVPGKSRFGDFQYEVGDVKSSTFAKAEQVMQVLFYSVMLEELQGVRPEQGFLILADGGEWRFPLGEYWRYFESVLLQARRVRDGLEGTEPVWSRVCRTCHWQRSCRAVLEDQQDLSLIPGMTRGRRGLLHQVGILTEGDLLHAPEDLVVPKLRQAHFQRLWWQVQARHQGRALPLQEVEQVPENRVYWTAYSDFARQGAVFAFAARVSGGEDEQVVFFADTPEDLPRVKGQVLGWLSDHLHLPWFTFESHQQTALETVLPFLPGLPQLTLLQKALWTSWALPVDGDDLGDIMAFLSGEIPLLEATDSVPLVYHQYLAERRAEIRQSIEEHMIWELSSMMRLHRWMTGQEGGEA